MSKLIEDSKNLQQLAKDLNYTPQEARLLKRRKLALFITEEDYEEALKKKDKIGLSIKIPLLTEEYYRQYLNLSEVERKEFLLSAGVDLSYPVIIDVECVMMERGVCGYTITAQERTDKAWVGLDSYGQTRASWEAQLESKQDPTLRGELSKLNGGSY